jgi:hypothetical protein
VISENDDAAGYLSGLVGPTLDLKHIAEPKSGTGAASPRKLTGIAEPKSGTGAAAPRALTGIAS